MKAERVRPDVRLEQIVPRFDPVCRGLLRLVGVLPEIRRLPRLSQLVRSGRQWHRALRPVHLGS